MSEHGGPAPAFFWLRDERNTLPPWRLDSSESSLRERYGRTYAWRSDWTMPTLEEVIFAAVRGSLPYPPGPDDDPALAWDTDAALAPSDSPFGRSWAECSALVFHGKADLLYAEDDEYRATIDAGESRRFGTSYMPSNGREDREWFDDQINGGDDDEIR